MSFSTSALLALVPVYGPWLIFAFAVLETCFVTGLAVPAGMSVSLGAILALNGTMHLSSVVVAAAAGGAIGDSAGFWIGRLAGRRLVTAQGRVAAMFARGSRGVGRRFGRHPLYSVTLARLISFVRTVMPMAAGMSPLPYRRFLPYELVGVAAWTVLYVSIGGLAGESWRHVVRTLNVGGALSLVAVLLLVWVLVRAATRRRARRAAGAGTTDSPC